ncbi:hypothetical protein E8E11_000394 [Didymella keratinophila]|nr:hypothetical protein E8E11_000394 [Didymella keratinophila]
MDFTCMDPQTVKLAIQLQLEGIADLLDSLYDDGEPVQGDERASLHTIQQDLQQQLTLLEGQVLVINILKDEYNERVAFKKLLDDEKQAVSDHQLAMRLAGMSIGTADAAFSADYEAQLDQADEEDDDAQWEMAKELYASAFDGDKVRPALEGGPVQPITANRAPPHGIRIVAEAPKEKDVLGSKNLVMCNACMEIVSIKTTLRLQCDHTYCRTCLLDLFTSSIANPILFPPRCCKLPIPLDTCRVMLAKDLIKDFDLKVEELATPNPTYCANADCSKFIRSKDIKNDVGHCVFCKSTTCVQCKNQSHTGLCPSDPHVQLLKDVAKRSKWQQCTECNNMVELAQGCFHMTCRCKHDGTKTISPVQIRSQSLDRRYSPNATKPRLSLLISTLGGAGEEQLVKTAARTGFHGLWAVATAASLAAGVAYTTAIKA